MAVEANVAKVYAEALLGVVQKEDIPLETVLAEAETLGYLLENLVDLRVFLEGPHIPTEDKHELVKKVFAENSPAYFYNLIRVCIDKDRTNALLDILTAFVGRVEAALGIHAVCIRTARPLEDDLRHEVHAALETFTGLRFRPRYIVEETLIGGIVVQYEDTLIDMSIRGQLLELRGKLEEAVKPLKAA